MMMNSVQKRHAVALVVNTEAATSAEQRSSCCTEGIYRRSHHAKPSLQYSSCLHWLLVQQRIKYKSVRAVWMSFKVRGSLTPTYFSSVVKTSGCTRPCSYINDSAIVSFWPAQTSPSLHSCRFSSPVICTRDLEQCCPMSLTDRLRTSNIGFRHF